MIALKYYSTLLLLKKKKKKSFKRQKERNITHRLPRRASLSWISSLALQEEKYTYE